MDDISIDDGVVNEDEIYVFPHRDRGSQVELVVDGMVSRYGNAIAGGDVANGVSVMRNHNVLMLQPGIDTLVSNPLVCVAPPFVDGGFVKWDGVGPVNVDHMYADRCDRAWLSRHPTFNVSEFERCSLSHPDRELITLILDNMRDGFRIGYHGDRVGMSPVRNRIKTDDTNKVSLKILEEVRAGRFAGPFPSPPFSHMRFSPLQAVPKDGTDIRLLINLSSPHGDSVNTYEVEHSMKYEGVDMVCAMIMREGQNSMLWKLDVKSAYRHVVIHPSDYHLLGFTWMNHYFFDTRCSFGARHSAYDWEYVGALLKWILVNYYKVGHMARWVDDYIGVTHKDKAQECYLKAQVACRKLGVPIHKLEAPSHSLSYCGVVFDTHSMSMSIPVIKRDELLSSLNKWETRVSCNKTDLQSLVGKLNHIAMVVRPGRAFIGRMLSCLRAHHHLRSFHHISLPACLQHDITWWALVLRTWSGTSMIIDQPWLTQHTRVLYVDASGTGRGVLFDKDWYSAQWSADILALASRDERESMPFLELYTIAEALYTYGSMLRQQRVIIHSDCLPCVDRIKKGHSANKHQMALLRSIAYACVMHEIVLRVVHIAGVDNNCADALSRAQLTRFQELVPDAKIIASIPCPPSHMDL